MQALYTNKLKLILFDNDSHLQRVLAHNKDNSKSSPLFQNKGTHSITFSNRL